MPFQPRPLLAAIALALAMPAHAEEPPPEQVIVTASRSNVERDKAPQTVVVIDKETIERQLTLSSNSSDVLSNLLPSYTPSRGKMNGSGETLRGRTPLILIDGVPQSNPVRPTGREAHTIDYAMVERIEIVQGPNAVNGLGATGARSTSSRVARPRARSTSISTCRRPRRPPTPRLPRWATRRPTVRTAGSTSWTICSPCPTRTRACTWTAPAARWAWT
ncbi:TonB-dependent receptor plug domain-containing protein [Pseudoduganella plicata]|uniref:TonB-dependent receptor plug domain-containing protein n=1 Tax=Pseudoduganella plicata TaxID=321984 RepID=UPI001E5E0297|nr:TonB-dependent receptor plug domain-containing protein [Pseudoduganella plicata]